jgi:hypothetical protein
LRGFRGSLENLEKKSEKFKKNEILKNQKFFYKFLKILNFKNLKIKILKI